MADSVREAILKNRKTALEAINGSPPYVGPAPKKVVRVSVYPQHEEPPLIMLPEPAENFESPLAEFSYGPASTRMQNWVHAYLLNDGKDPGTDLSNLIQDILRAWLLDLSCGDLAQLTRPLRLEPVGVHERDDIIGVRILFETHYRWKLKEPTETI